MSLGQTKEIWCSSMREFYYTVNNSKSLVSVWTSKQEPFSFHLSPFIHTSSHTQANPLCCTNFPGASLLLYNVMGQLCTHNLLQIIQLFKPLNLTLDPATEVYSLLFFPPVYLLWSYNPKIHFFTFDQLGWWELRTLHCLVLGWFNWASTELQEKSAESWLGQWEQRIFPAHTFQSLQRGFLESCQINMFSTSFFFQCSKSCKSFTSLGSGHF